MNVTVATELIRKDFKWTHSQYEAAARKAPVGSDGLLLLPYLEGERTPNVPDGTGVYFGVRAGTFTEKHFARATMEGVTLGMNYGLRRLSKLGVKPSQIRATGGGSKSKLWRQIMADVFNAQVVTLKVSEGAAYGAALQALWTFRNQKEAANIGIEEITDRFVKLNSRETAEPNPKNVASYKEIQSLQDKLSISLRKQFNKHRNIVARAQRN